MGKPRRPRAGHSNWQPKPPLAAELPAPPESLAEALSETSADVSVTALSRAAFAEAEPVLASAPERDTVAPAEPQTEPHIEREADTPDSVIHAASPAEADHDAEARQDIPDEPHADDPADPETELDAVPPPDLVPAPVAPRAADASALNRIVFAPDRIDVIEIGATIARYVQGEGAAALAHFRALSDVRTPADLIRLQVGEVQRAADASLTCWVTVMGKASRVVAVR